MRNVLTLALLACLASPLTSNAQIFVAGGLSFPVSPDEVSDAYSSGWGVTGGVALDLPLIPITPRAWLNFDSFGLDEDELQVDVEGGGLRLLTVAVDAKLNLPLGPISPYVAPAAGVTFVSTEDVELGGVDVGSSDSETATTLGLGAGLAMDLLIGPELFVEAKVLYALTSGDNLLWTPIRVGIVLGI